MRNGTLRGSDVAFYISIAVVAVILCAIIGSLLGELYWM
jgi:hypothetical protein